MAHIAGAETRASIMVPATDIAKVGIAMTICITSPLSLGGSGTHQQSAGRVVTREADSRPKTITFYTYYERTPP